MASNDELRACPFCPTLAGVRFQCAGIYGHAGPHTFHNEAPDFDRITAALAEKDGGGWMQERVAQITAHRACCGVEHDPAQGKLHGYCIVCGVPWPCEYAGQPPLPTERKV